MREVTSNNFGLAISFLLPGFVALLGVSFFSETVETWLNVASPFAPTVGGFLYVTLGLLAAGLTVSTVRWAIIDTIHHRTGIPAPRWDFSKLQDRVGAYRVIQENHYFFYLFYGCSPPAAGRHAVGSCQSGLAQTPSGQYTRWNWKIESRTSRGLRTAGVR